MPHDELRYEYGDGRRSKRPPRPVTEATLRRAAQRYVERYGGPSASVRATLQRQVRRAKILPGDAEEQARTWIEAVIADLVTAGALDDGWWARERARVLAERGMPARRIRERLRQKRLATEHIDAALAAIAEQSADPELDAAIAYARRRGFGPFRRVDRSERRRKDLAAMARAGFGYGLAVKVIDAENEDALHD